MCEFSFIILCILRCEDVVGQCISIIIAVGLLQNASVSAKINECLPEKSSVLINSAQVIFVWELSKTCPNEVVISKPPCVDLQDRLVVRLCENGVWSQNNKCSKVLKDVGTCPYGTLQATENSCIFTTSARKWTDSFMKFESGEYKKSDKFWLAYRRTVHFGPFEFNDIGINHSEPTITGDYIEYFTKDCLLLDTNENKMKLSNCNELHPAIRELPKNTVLYNCPKNCYPTGLLNFNCYCREYSTNDDKNLATINNLFQKELLKKVAAGEICRIKSPVGSLDAITYINESNWQYGNIDTSCSIQIKSALKVGGTTLTLSFEDIKRKLYLTVYSPENLVRSDDEYEINCFTDASDELRKELDIDLVLGPFDNFEGADDQSKSSYSRIVFEVELKKYIGDYWCEAFTLNLVYVKSNQVIAYEKDTDNEYAMRIILKDVCKLYPCNKRSGLFKSIVKIALKPIFAFVDAKIRVMKIYNFMLGTDILDMLVHISTQKHMKVEDEYTIIVNSLNKISKNFIIVYFKSSEYCLPAETLGKYKMRWPLTKIGQSVVSEDICFTRYGVPVVRTCIGDFLEGVSWSEINGDCDDIAVPRVSKFLHESCLKNITLDVVKSIDKVVSTSSSLTVLDVYYCVKILSKIKDAPNAANFLQYILSIIESLMKVDSEIINKSQELLKVSDETIDAVEEYLLKLNYVLDTIPLYNKTSKFLVHLTNPFKSNISGILLYNHENSTRFEDLTLVNFERNFTLKNVNTTNLELAVHVPESVLVRISNSTAEENSNFVISTTIFQNDHLFIDLDYHSASYILNVDMPGYGSYLENPLPVLLRSKTSGKKNICGFWNTGDRIFKKKGTWSDLGANYLGTFNESNLHFCSFVHLTNFALLIMSDKHISSIETPDDEGDLDSINMDDYNEFYLDIITIVGTMISAIGICGIFLTATIAEQWRSKIGTKMLMNLSAAILLETITLHLSEIRSLRTQQPSCKILGISLHYFVISKFCWMLIYAYLQYLRFVRVLGSIPNNLLLKSVIFGWGLPLIFVAIVGLSATEDLYESKSYQLCYPRGLLLYSTILLPVVLILLANICIFFKIMYEITHSKAKPSNNHAAQHKLQLYLAILLFFVLGIPWMFGIIAELMSECSLKVALFYIFCTTTTLQGFVLFLFYVVFNKETRNDWINYISKITKKC